MRIGKRRLILMGATPQIIAIWQRVPLVISWHRDGYRINGVITANRLTASQILRYIAAAEHYKP